MRIEQFIVAEETAIGEAIRQLDRNGHGIVFICENKHVKAVLSDGDFRRYILQGGDVTKSVKEIANYSPKVLPIEEQALASKFMKEQHITAVPFVNKNNEIIKIQFENGELVQDIINDPVPVIIMAGGKGTRLDPYTRILPKPLIPIGEKTITEHIMESFEKVGCNCFFMIVNYKKNLIKSFFQESDKKVEFFEEEQFLGTGGGLKLVTGKIKDTAFVTNCDILVNADYNTILNYHKSNKNIVTMVCAKKTETLEYGTVEMNENGQVLELKEKPQHYHLINTGLYLIEKEFLDEIPEDTFIHITDLIKACIAKGKRVGAYVVSEEAWMDMGQFEALDNMKDRLELL